MLDDAEISGIVVDLAGGFAKPARFFPATEIYVIRREESRENCEGL